MGGMAASANWTSTAGPAIWITCPMFSDIDEISVLNSLSAQLLPTSITEPAFLLGCRCSTYYFYDFFCDLSLARSVHDQRQRLDHIAGIAGGCIHRGHASGVLGGHRFQERMKNLDTDVLRKNSLKKLLGRLLVDIVYRRASKGRSRFIDRVSIGGPHPDTCRLRCFEPLFTFLDRRLFRHLNINFSDLLDGEQSLGHKALRDDRFEFIEENVDAVDFTSGIARDHALAESASEAVLNFAQYSHVFPNDLHAVDTFWSNLIFELDGRNGRLSFRFRSLGSNRVASPHEVTAFAAYAFHVYVLIWF